MNGLSGYWEFVMSSWLNLDRTSQPSGHMFRLLLKQTILALNLHGDLSNSLCLVFKMTQFNWIALVDHQQNKNTQKKKKKEKIHLKSITFKRYFLLINNLLN